MFVCIYLYMYVCLYVFIDLFTDNYLVDPDSSSKSKSLALSKKKSTSKVSILKVEPSKEDENSVNSPLCSFNAID
jgi:hypothetical protein